ncbi:uncharacterized protein LOC133412706 isoform X2 [Phycodurus eques]|uniref:uncharacterized protein LOC133412706 isoform X2 n=1 Tax=Phycodurus eques TaxID=693459 RepID=UPI002ACEA776|nr:uncharacterized protein LOC133412706 isoform X2 [Phycodurus eques]
MNPMAASSSVTSVGGVLIVTQVIPRDGSAVPPQADTPAPPADARAAPPASPAKENAKSAAHRRGLIPGLGVSACAPQCVKMERQTRTSFVCAGCPDGHRLAFLASGWLAVAARRRTSATLVWACLWSNAVSVLLSLGGAAYLSWLLATGRPAESVCGDRLAGDGKAWSVCVENLWLLDRALSGLRGLFLVVLLLQAAVCAALCVFTAGAIRTRQRYAPITVPGEDGCCGGEPEAQPESP